MFFPVPASISIPMFPRMNWSSKQWILLNVDMHGTSVSNLVTHFQVVTPSVRDTISDLLENILYSSRSRSLWNSWKCLHMAAGSILLPLQIMVLLIIPSFSFNLKTSSSKSPQSFINNETCFSSSLLELLFYILVSPY